MSAAGVCGGEAQPLTVPASRSNSERRDKLGYEPSIYVNIHNPWIRRVTEWRKKGSRYFSIDIGFKIAIFVDDIEEFMDELREAIENRRVVEE